MSTCAVAYGDKAKAMEARTEIYNALGAATASVVRLEASWIWLGTLLADFKAKGQWQPLGYAGFEQFILELRDTYNRGKTQLLMYVSVAEKLLPTISPNTLEEIGISKCAELKRAITRNNGAALPESIIEAAKKQTTTIKELRCIIGATLNISDDREKGTWFDFEGCYFTPEERREFVEAIHVAKKHLDIKAHVPNHIQRKEIFLAFAREYFSTWAPEVYANKG
jgi:hypothetical protein